MSDTPRVIGSVPEWSADERPSFSGSPALIQHSKPKRFAYLCIGVFISITALLNNGFIIANLPLFQGEYGLTPSQAAWLPVSFVVASACSNLLVFKARQQFGVRAFSEVGLLILIAVLLLHLVVRTYEMALFARFMAGVASAPLSTLGMYYIRQAFSKANGVKALYLSFGLQQLAIPLAWVISPSLTVGNSWENIYTFELGIALCTLAMVVALKLPSSFRQALFEKRDFVTFSLLVSGITCLCIMLSQGPILWWFDSTNLAILLIAGLALVLLGLSFEYFRDNPLLMTRWLGSKQIIIFIIGAFLLRLILSEQSVAMVNFLRVMDMGPEQFVPLYAIILLGSAIGTLFSMLTFKMERAVPYLILSVFLILLACLMDYDLTHDIRPSNFYLSQFLIGFATGTFVPILLLLAVGHGLSRGPQYLITIMVIFSITQNLGGIAGNSLFTTYQKVRTQDYIEEISLALTPTNPLVEQRLAAYQQGTISRDSDPQQQVKKALLNLNNNVNREAQVRAYSDVIALNASIALLILLWGLIRYKFIQK